MHDSYFELSSRLERLERENVRLRRFGAAACLGAALLGLAGAAAPALCDVVSAERLVLRDESGRQRLVVDAYRNDGPVLTVHSREGRALARLGVDARGEAYLALLDEKGASRASYSSGPTTPARAEAKRTAEKPAEVVGTR